MQILRIRTKFMFAWVILDMEFSHGLTGRQPSPVFKIKSYQVSNSVVTVIFSFRISMFESYVMHKLMRLRVVKPLSLYRLMLPRGHAVLID